MLEKNGNLAHQGKGPQYREYAATCRTETEMIVRIRFFEGKDLRQNTLTCKRDENLSSSLLSAGQVSRRSTRCSNEEVANQSSDESANLLEKEVSCPNQAGSVANIL